MQLTEHTLHTTAGVAGNEGCLLYGSPSPLHDQGQGEFHPPSPFYDYFLLQLFYCLCQLICAYSGELRIVKVNISLEK